MANVSFTGYIPVTFFAKRPSDGKYVPVLKEDNIRKCQSFVVRNLNQTAKNLKNDEFVKTYKNTDKDYARNPIVRSIYDTEAPVVYLITGTDVDVINSFGKDMRLKKIDIYERTGKKNTHESKEADREYYTKTRSFLKNICKRVKNENGEKLTLQVFFDPKYTKKEGKLKGFEYKNVKFITNGKFENPS